MVVLVKLTIGGWDVLRLTECRVRIPQHHAAKRRELVLSVFRKRGKSSSVDITFAGCIGRTRGTDINLDVLVGRLRLGPVVPGSEVVVRRMVKTTEVVI